MIRRHRRLQPATVGFSRHKSQTTTSGDPGEAASRSSFSLPLEAPPDMLMAVPAGDGRRTSSIDPKVYLLEKKETHHPYPKMKPACNLLAAGKIEPTSSYFY